MIASFAVRASTKRWNLFEELYARGEVELEIVPQGTLAERIRAGGAGIPAFYTPTGVGTVVAEGKRVESFEGRQYLLERALIADFAFIRAYKADRLGNLVYRKASRNFNEIMATAARVTIAEVEEIVEPGELDPETIVTPAVFVDRIVKAPAHVVRWFN
jgi:3-oxoacid CoA-transferase subunit A